MWSRFVTEFRFKICSCLALCASRKSNLSVMDVRWVNAGISLKLKYLRYRSWKTNAFHPSTIVLYCYDCRINIAFYILKILKHLQWYVFNCALLFLNYFFLLHCSNSFVWVIFQSIEINGFTHALNPFYNYRYFFSVNYKKVNQYII